ncbi:MAG: tetratricopeptide repeat protein [Saprospiraceae bacterium]
MADEASVMEEGMSLARQALENSMRCGFLSGEGWARLKIAFLEVEQDPSANVSPLWERALFIARATNDDFMQALTHVQMGKFYMYNNDFDAAEAHYRLALDTYFEKENNLYTAVIYNDMGFLQGKKGRRNAEAEWYFQAMKSYEALSEWHGWANSASNYANVLFRLDQRAQAVRYAREAYSIHERNKNSSGIATVSGNLTAMYLRMNDLDSAIYYQRISLENARINQQTKHLIQGHNNLSQMLDQQGKTAEAIFAARQALVVGLQVGDRHAIARAYNRLALLYGKTEMSDSTDYFFDRAYRLADSLNQQEIRMDICAGRAAYYRKKEDYKNAYEWFFRYREIMDSLEVAKLRNNITELQIQYESERKDAEIERLHIQDQIQRLEIEKRNALLKGNMLEVQRKEQEIRLLQQAQQLKENALLQREQALRAERLMAQNREKSLQLTRQALNLSRKDQEIAERHIQRQRMLMGAGVLAALFAGLFVWLAFSRYQLRKDLREKEAIIRLRNLIAKDLHDEIGSSLTHVNILHELTQRSFDSPALAGKYLKQSTDVIRLVNENLSEIVWSINPNKDELSDLILRMQQHARTVLHDSGIACELSFPEQGDHLTISMDKRRHVYLLFKEALNNLVKYSKASLAQVSLSIEGRELTLVIEDNGVGFDPKSVTRGNGLHSMRFRAEHLGAAFSVRAAPEAGVRISLHFSV